MTDRPKDLPKRTVKIVLAIAGAFLLLLILVLVRAVKSVEPNDQGTPTNPAPSAPLASSSPLPPLPAGAPRVLAQTQNSPHDFAVFGDSVFFSTHGSDDNLTGEIMKVSVLGGAPEVLVRRQRNPHQVVAAGGFIYWLVTADADGAVMRMPIGGGSASRVASTFIFADGALTADATHVYWMNKNRLMRAAHGTSAVETIAEAGDPNITVRALAIHSGVAYWFSGSTLWYARVEEKRAVTMASGTDGPWDLTVDDSGVFWTDRRVLGNAADGEIWKILFSTAKAAVVYRPVRLPWGVAVDRHFVYWASNTGKGVITRAPKAGGSVQVLATNQSYPVEVQVDERAIYWNNAESNEIMMLSK